MVVRLGGGLELGLSAHRIVAARESYVGLVETAVGLVPAGGGCKETVAADADRIAGCGDGFPLSRE